MSIKFTVSALSQNGFKNDKTKDDWKLRCHGATVPSGRLNIEAVPVLIGDEKKIDGVTVVERALAGGSGGQHLAEYLLENQNAISKELRGKVLVFADTEWFGGGALLVPCLYWDGGKWYLDFYYLGLDWDSGSLFVRLCA